MNKRFVKSIIVQILGALAVRVNVYGFNPIGIGMYTAVMSSRLINWPTIFVMTGSMIFFWGFLSTVKYSLVMLATFVLITILKDRNNRVNPVAGALAGSVLYTAMEIADVYMSKGNISQYGIVSIVGILTFSSSVVINKILDVITLSGRKMENNRRINIEKSMENVYEEKIKMIASSFEKISKSISTMSREDEAVNCIACGEVPVSQVQMINEIWKGRLMDSQQAIALQLGEMSKILNDCTTASYMFVNMGEDRERYLRLKLKNMGISIKKIVMINNRRGINELNITLKASKMKCITIKDIENAISDCFGKRYKQLKDKGHMVKKEYSTYNFIEEPNYFVLHGIARRGIEGNSISGDNFTCMNLQSGQTLLSVSDGMGHGLKAYKESEMVLSLLEELMEGGFSEEVALKLINTVFMIESNEINPASVDMGIIDLYSGVCDFLKIGAATTFVKRGGWVEAIRSNSMPMGAASRLDMETSTKKLYDGDFVIMMSDGIVEAIKEEDKEKHISKILMNLNCANPQDMADEILKQVLKSAEKEKEDDMLVMVAGVWDKCA